MSAILLSLGVEELELQANCLTSVFFVYSDAIFSFFFFNIVAIRGLMLFGAR